MWNSAIHSDQNSIIKVTTLVSHCSAYALKFEPIGTGNGTETEECSFLIEASDSF